MRKETKDILENHVRDVGFSELLIAMGLVFILGVISAATSMMTNLQVKRQALKLDKQEAFYTAELAAWHFYYKNDGASQPCSNEAGSGGRCIVSITNETIHNETNTNQTNTNQTNTNQTNTNQTNTNQTNTNQTNTNQTNTNQTNTNQTNTNVYHPESYQPGVPLPLTITSLFDTKNTILRRYTGDNVKIKNLARADIVSFCGEMSFATRTRTFSICLVSPPELPPYPPPPTGSKTGKMTVNIPGPSRWDFAKAIALQADGKIVVAGESGLSNSAILIDKFSTQGVGGEGFALIRLLPDGNLDLAFGEQGMVITPFTFTSGVSGATAVAIQNDGKIVAAGVGKLTSGFALARYQSDGSLDASFGSSGRVITTFEGFGLGGSATAYALKILADGKMVVGGTYQGKIALAKYNTDGTLYSTFGSGGLVSYELPSLGETAAAGTTIKGLGVQQDGKIVVGGEYMGYGGKYFAVARFSPDGSIDTSFGDQGSTRTQFVQSGGLVVSARAQALVIQSDGKIVLAGSIIPSWTDVAMARYDTSGNLDLTFGNNGWVITEFLGLGYDEAFAVAVGATGKITIAGAVGEERFLAATYSPDGVFERTFSSPEEEVGIPSRFSAIAIQPDGKIVGAGRRGVWEFSNFAVVRYLENGERDTSFGTALGVATTDFPFPTDVAVAMTRQPDGKILVAGVTDSKTGSYPILGLARLNPDGSIDSTFGNNGRVFTAFPAQTSVIFGVAVQSNGKIVVAGKSASQMVLARYQTDGALDNTFGTDGIVLRDAWLSFGDCGAFALAIQSDDKIVVAGRGPNFMVARFNPNGSLDGSFGGVGAVTQTLNSGTYYQGFATSVGIQNDGKILAAGLILVAQYHDFVLARYLPNGSFDTAFGENGIVNTDFSPAGISAVEDRAFSLALQNDGKIVVAGYTEAIAGSAFAIARYTTDGNLDAAFGSGGKVVTPIYKKVTGQTGNFERAFSVVVQNDGRIVVAGYMRTKNNVTLAWENNDMVFIRYNPSGKIDQTFGINGIFILPFGKRDPPYSYPRNDIAYAMALYYASDQEPGRVIAVGSTHRGSDTDFAITRLNWMGGLDTTFGLPPGTPNSQ